MDRILSSRGGKKVIVSGDTVIRTYPADYTPEEGDYTGSTQEGLEIILAMAELAGCKPETEISVDSGSVTVEMPRYEDAKPGRETGIETANIFSRLLFRTWANEGFAYTPSTAIFNEEALKCSPDGLVLVDLDPYLNRKSRFTPETPSVQHMQVIASKLGHPRICPDILDRMTAAGYIAKTWMEAFPEDVYGEIPIEVLMAAQPDLADFK